MTAPSVTGHMIACHREHDRVTPRSARVSVGPMGRWRLKDWPVVRQVRSGDLLGRGPAVTSQNTRDLRPRTSTADRVVQSVCPYCAVGCGQRIFVEDEKVIDIE